ncbi:transglutaminase family protein [Variovorax sp. OV329]|uniref:transglutaminase-like domain-containing protein n=1 Tax=Variovorax sp. OV329 TaxID=1882825 RepID=UPI0008EA55CC|nr:transglutaminase family protein [Variovorax sp. OV329]SFN48153.1 Transglutaminase-like enzyme, putative cysteine protease [Variovorax sp. OV329]
MNINSGAVTRMGYSVELTYRVNRSGADFLFNVQAASTGRQRIVRECLEIGPSQSYQEYVDQGSSTRLLRLRADSGALIVRYDCEVDLEHAWADPGTVTQTWIGNLPGEVLPFLYPSRYCESDRLSEFAHQRFGTLPQGYVRAQTICDWVRHHVVFTVGSSGGCRTAVDTFASRQGVCRDFAHLMIALCRALNIPARFVTGFDYGADPDLGPTDFHAYVELYLGDHWYLFDPSGTAIPMGLVRLASGRDASDCAYATIFGDVTPLSRWLTVEPLAGRHGQLNIPRRCELALSTDDGPVGSAFSPARVASSMSNAAVG